MFGKVKEEFLALIDVGLKTDQTFAVGILVRTEEYIKETESSSSSFVLNILNGIFKKATLIFEKFVVCLPNSKKLGLCVRAYLSSR